MRTFAFILSFIVVNICTIGMANAQTAIDREARHDTVIVDTHAATEHEVHHPTHLEEQLEAQLEAILGEKTGKAMEGYRMGLTAMTYKQFIMILIGLLFAYLSIAKKYEPLLLLPLAFGIILGNIPMAEIGRAHV